MGGMGSGRHWSFGGADTTEDLRAIDVRRWKRDGLLSPGQVFGWNWTVDGRVQASIQVRTKPGRVVLVYGSKTGDGARQEHNCPIRLDTTPCHLGGKRHWFYCPAAGCNKRVAILYLGRALFACRACHRIVYRSQNENALDRAARKTEKLQVRLGWDSGIFYGEREAKPKGMHWRTFERLCKEHDGILRSAMAGVKVMFGS
jgi:hypothetical protein